METEAWLRAAVFVIVVGVAWLAARCVQHWVCEPGWLPKKLRGSTLAYVERTFRSVELPLLVARVDRAYRNQDRVITLLEFKTRGEVLAYSSDVIELSVQRLALMGETGEVVSTAAWVVVESHGRRKPLRVSLMNTGEIAGLLRRRSDLLAGRRAPRARPGMRGCPNCVWLARCKPGSVLNEVESASM